VGVLQHLGLPGSSSFCVDRPPCLPAVGVELLHVHSWCSGLLGDDGNGQAPTASHSQTNVLTGSTDTSGSRRLGQLPHGGRAATSAGCIRVTEKAAAPLICSIFSWRADPTEHGTQCQVVEIRERRLDEDEVAAEVAKAVDGIKKERRELLSKKAKLLEQSLAVINQVLPEKALSTPHVYLLAQFGCRIVLE